MEFDLLNTLNHNYPNLILEKQEGLLIVYLYQKVIIQKEYPEHFTYNHIAKALKYTSQIDFGEQTKTEKALRILWEEVRKIKERRGGHE